MPQLIQHIDAIARKKARDVLFLTFNNHGDAEGEETAQLQPARAEGATVRDATIAWLEAHGIEWEPCGAVANPDVMSRAPGWVYVDVPFDDQDTRYCALRDYLERPDGSMVHIDEGDGALVITVV